MESRRVSGNGVPVARRSSSAKRRRSDWGSALNVTIISTCRPVTASARCWTKARSRNGTPSCARPTRWDSRTRNGTPIGLTDEQARTGLSDAALTGTGMIRARRVAFGVTDSAFIMGSMGSVVGERLTRLVERATEQQLPLIIISGSGGGARMHEGILSLMQMAKVSAALARFDRAGGLFISVLTNPTMGGVAASFASLGRRRLCRTASADRLRRARVPSRPPSASSCPRDFRPVNSCWNTGSSTASCPERNSRAKSPGPSTTVANNVCRPQNLAPAFASA